MNRILLIIYSLLTATVCLAASPKREVRAVWLTTIGGIDWPHSYAQSPRSIEKQQAELRMLLDRYQQAGINTVLIQTRVRGTVIYPSAIEPWDGCLSGFPGKSPGYDALKFVIDECHRRGMELHAWVVTMPTGKWGKLGCTTLRKRYPGLVRKIGADGYMNPEDPRTATYLATLCEEITRHYDIDGIHLDYIRYPETWPIRVSRNQGRACITAIVRAIHDHVKALKPWVKMSCSPVGKYDDLARYWSHGWNAYTAVCQDAQGWLREGLMDELFPMMYFRGDQFFPFSIDWAEQSHGRIVAPGLGIYFLDPREGNWRLADVTQEMSVLRQQGLGHAFFRGKFLTDDCQGIYRFTQQFDHALALVPAMTWEHASVPEAPVVALDEGGVALDKSNGSNSELHTSVLRWHGATPYYNIYSSHTWPVDINDAENLVLMRTNCTSIPMEAGRYYAVTAMDRYGNESAATQSHQRQAATVTQALLACDGERLWLPRKETADADGHHGDGLLHLADVDLLAVETLQGSIIATLPHRCAAGATVDIRTVPAGFYVLRSLGRKGITHRLGYFKVER